MKYGLHNNPNDLITDLTGKILLDVEVESLNVASDMESQDEQVNLK